MKVYLPYLNDWSASLSNLNGLLGFIAPCFGSDPPVVLRSQAAPPALPPQPTGGINENIQNQKNELKELKNATNAVIFEEKNARNNLKRAQADLKAVKEQQRTLQRKYANTSEEIKKIKGQLNTLAKRKEELQNKEKKLMQRGIFLYLYFLTNEFHRSNGR